MRKKIAKNANTQKCEIVRIHFVNKNQRLAGSHFYRMYYLNSFLWAKQTDRLNVKYSLWIVFFYISLLNILFSLWSVMDCNFATFKRRNEPNGAQNAGERLYHYWHYWLQSKLECKKCTENMVNALKAEWKTIYFTCPLLCIHKHTHKDRIGFKIVLEPTTATTTTTTKIAKKSKGRGYDEAEVSLQDLHIIPVQSTVCNFSSILAFVLVITALIHYWCWPLWMIFSFSPHFINISMDLINLFALSVSQSFICSIFAIDSNPLGTINS